MSELVAGYEDPKTCEHRFIEIDGPFMPLNRMGKLYMAACHVCGSALWNPKDVDGGFASREEILRACGFGEVR